MHGKFYIITYLVITCACAINCQKTKSIKLRYGEIMGKEIKTVYKKTPYYSFQGIPYAKPPIGDLRFASPQPPDNWSTTLDATKPRSICLELYATTGSEDCLYLNVFAPKSSKPLPTIVWIHGGGFVFVFANYSLSGVDFFMDEEVIFVTVHYRLGPFGFLSTEDDIIPGNYGIKDQVMAVNWVYENIHKFGGNPNKITVMGQSAGATSTSYMSLIPELQGKISGIIQQSGSCICPFSLTRDARLGAYVVSTRLGNQSIDSNVILEVLRKVDANALRNASETANIDIIYGTGSFQGLLYIPTLEPRGIQDALLTEMPYEQLKNGRFNKIPRMIGINSLEGMYISDEFNASQKYYSNYDQIVKRYIPISMNTRSESVGELIRKHYTHNTPFLSNISNAIHFASDDQFVRPILKDASFVSKYSTTYLYQFSYQGKLGRATRPFDGVDHGEELPYLFHDKNQVNVSKKDQRVRRKLVRLWSNFAKYGNPTPVQDELLDSQTWSPIDPDKADVDYMNIDDTLTPALNPHQKDVEFWNNLYDTYGNPPFDTY